MKANAAQIKAALDRPSPDLRLFLLHGPDEAAAFDHAARLARAMGKDAERVDLDGSALKGDPARLADEAAALSLFGGARWVRATGVTDDALEAFETLLAADRAGSPVLAIAPTLKTTAKLVKLATDSRAALVLGCWMPDARAADGIAVEIARAHGLRPVGGAAHRLAEASGGDRAVMTREVEKLALFLDAGEDRPRELDDAALDAVGADLGEAEAGAAIDALVDGRSADLGAELQRLREAGVSPVLWLRQLATRLMLLADLQLEAERGGDPKPLMKRRGVHWSKEAQTAAALRRWTGPMLARALDRVAAAERAEKSFGTAGEVLASATALETARGVERRR